MLDSSIEWLKMKLPLSPEVIVKKKKEQSSYHWTGDITYLVELAYALLETDCINNGEIQITAFIEFLSECFNIEIKRPSDSYYKMRSRVGSRTIFLDKMKKLLELRMDRYDEKNYSR